MLLSTQRLEQIEVVTKMKNFTHLSSSDISLNRPPTLLTDLLIVECHEKLSHSCHPGVLSSITFCPIWGGSLGICSVSCVL